MSRKAIISMLAVFFGLGLCSVAFAGDPDRVSDLSLLDSEMSGHSMQDSMNVSATGHAATHDNRDSADIDSEQEEMQGQGSAPCAVVIAKASSVTEVTSDCRNQYRDQYGG